MPRFIDDGGWVPIDKAGVAHLPRDRSYSEVEAMFSLTVDLAEGRTLSVRDYSRVWRWTRGRVHGFLQRAAGQQTGQETDRKTDSMRQREFSYVSELRRSSGHENGQQNGQQTVHDRTTTTDPRRNQRREERSRETDRRQKPPWYGLSKDLDALLACDAYIAHLAGRSSILAQWSAAEIRSWARAVITKGNEKRAAGSEQPITSFAHYLQQCVPLAQKWERPEHVEPQALPEVDAAAEDMRL